MTMLRVLQFRIVVDILLVIPNPIEDPLSSMCSGARKEDEILETFETKSTKSLRWWCSKYEALRIEVWPCHHQRPV